MPHVSLAARSRDISSTFMLLRVTHRLPPAFPNTPTSYRFKQQCGGALYHAN